jgi:predicted metal-binding protein
MIKTKEPYSLATKRRKLAHVLVCDGCCCGRTEKGRPEVPLEFLKTEWKQRKLLATIQLTISGCLGPCDLANVVSVQSLEGTVYLGKLDSLAQYQALLEWATACKAEETLLPLPELFAAQHFEQFQSAEELRATNALKEAAIKEAGISKEATSKEASTTTQTSTPNASREQAATSA